MTAGLIMNILTKLWTAKLFFKTRKIFWRSLSGALRFSFGSHRQPLQLCAEKSPDSFLNPGFLFSFLIHHTIVK
jgi:hypothetical protein